MVFVKLNRPHTCGNAAALTELNRHTTRMNIRGRVVS